LHKKKTNTEKNNGEPSPTRESSCGFSIPILFATLVVRQGNTLYTKRLTFPGTKERSNLKFLRKIRQKMLIENKLYKATKFSQNEKMQYFNFVCTCVCLFR
jgi:hypothetical protein